MTISMAWVRTVDNTQELIFATDSRLRFGGYWDCCPKLLSMPRNDSVIGFAGDTIYAYPIMLQIVSTIENYHKALTRALPLEELKGHILRVLNDMLSKIEEKAIGHGDPDVTFIFGGYCWYRADFLLWLIHYDRSIGRFTFRPVSRWRGGHDAKYMVITGDYTDDAKSRLVALLRERRKVSSGGFDMEPLEVLRDMIRDGAYPLIGGTPQVMKVYKHMNCRPFAVFDPKTDSTSLMGRPMLDYERGGLMINLETMESFNSY